jgi:DnaK suppressor protein
MDKEMLTNFRVILETQLNQLLTGQQGQFAGLGEVGDIQDPMDLADLASAHYDREFMHRIQYRNMELMREIYAALRRLDDGSFGICDVCSDFIRIERLKAQPTTTVCINCKKLQEMSNRLKAA